MLSATAWPEQQQLVALALLNLRECDADEYERGDVAATAGAAGGAAPALPSCPFWAEPTAHPLQQQFVSVPMGLGFGTGIRPANSYAVEDRIFPSGLQEWEGQRVIGVPCATQHLPATGPHGGVEQAARQAWARECHRTQRGRGTHGTCPLCPQPRTHPWHCASPAAAARKPG